MRSKEPACQQLSGLNCHRREFQRPFRSISNHENSFTCNNSRCHCPLMSYDSNTRQIDTKHDFPCCVTYIPSRPSPPMTSSFSPAGILPFRLFVAMPTAPRLSPAVSAARPVPYLNQTAININMPIIQLFTDTGAEEQSGGRGEPKGALSNLQNCVKGFVIVLPGDCIFQGDNESRLRWELGC